MLFSLFLEKDIIFKDIFHSLDIWHKAVKISKKLISEVNVKYFRNFLHQCKFWIIFNKTITWFVLCLIYGNKWNSWAVSPFYITQNFYSVEKKDVEFYLVILCQNTWYNIFTGAILSVSHGQKGGLL